MRFGTILASLALGLTLSTVALAVTPSRNAECAHGARAHKHGQTHYPMGSADFKQHLDAKIAKKRARMESRASKLSAQDARDLRAKFDQGVARVQQEVAAATADGSVTADEAKKVRETMHTVFPHGHHAKS
jgi:hypothetical protein